MNASPIGGFRRDEGGRGKRGDSRRQNANNAFIDNTWKSSRANYPVDTLKLKAVTQKVRKNLDFFKKYIYVIHTIMTYNVIINLLNSH